MGAAGAYISRACLAWGVAAVLTAPAHARQTRSGPEEVVDAALVSQGIDLRHPRSDVIVAWNSLAHDIAFAEDQFLTFKGQRALAMMHLAMHDALNAIVPVYETYAFTGSVRLAHPIAAAAQAAHDVLQSQYPGQQAALADQLTKWLAHVPSSVLRDRGIALGQATAAAVVARRNGDGWNFQGTYEFGEGPGRYQTTPPWNGFVAWPGFRFAKPFVLEYPHQFRPSPPPPLRTQGLRPRARRSPGVRRRRQHKPDDRSDRVCGLVDGIRRRVGQSPGEAALHRPADASLASGPDVRAHWRGAVRHATSRPGTQNTSTTIGDRTPRFGQQTRTATRIRCLTPTGSRSVRHHRFRSTPRPTRRPVRPRSVCSRTRSDAT